MPEIRFGTHKEFQRRLLNMRRDSLLSLPSLPSPAPLSASLPVHFSSPICSVPKIKCAQRKQTVGYHLKAPNGICLCRAEGGGTGGEDGAGAAVGEVAEGLVQTNNKHGRPQKSVADSLAWPPFIFI